MPKRIWVAEGFAGDGAVYGRVLQLPQENTNHRPQPIGTDIQRTQIAVLKSHLGDIAACPCFSAIVFNEGEEKQPEQRGY